MRGAPQPGRTDGGVTEGSLWCGFRDRMTAPVSSETGADGCSLGLRAEYKDCERLLSLFILFI